MVSAAAALCALCQGSLSELVYSFTFILDTMYHITFHEFSIISIVVVCELL